MDDIVERLRAYSPAVCAGCDQWNECGYGLPCDCECHDSPCSDAAHNVYASGVGRLEMATVRRYLAKQHHQPSLF